MRSSLQKFVPSVILPEGSGLFTLELSLQVGLTSVYFIDFFYIIIRYRIMS